MAQDYTVNCYDPNHAVNTDMSSVEKNFEVLRTKFSGSSAPSSPVAGQWWADTGANMLKIRNSTNSTWLNVYNYSNGEVYIATTIRKASLIEAQAISPASCTLKTPTQVGANFPVTYKPGTHSIYSLAWSDVEGMATQVVVSSGQNLVGRIELTTGGSAAYTRFVVGSAASSEGSVASNTTGWTGTMSLTVSGSGWQTLRWQAKTDLPASTATVGATSISLG